MSSVNLNSQSRALDQLRTINLLAQSTEEKVAGRIGLLNDTDGNPRVIKFNTHLGERLFGPKASPEMLQSCNNLRARMCTLLDEALADNPDLAQKLKRQIGDSTTSRKLLDRSIVASVIKDVETAVNQGKEGAGKVSLGNAEYDRYGASSFGVDTHFASVIARANGDQPKAVVDNEVQSAHPFGETTAEIKAKIEYDDALESVPKESLTKNKQLAKVLVNDLKRLEFDEEARTAARNQVIDLKTLKDFNVEKVDDMRHATTKEKFEDFFECVEGGTADVVAAIRKEDPNARVCAHIFADNTDFLCGIDACWPSQEEALAYVSDCEPFKKLVADGKVKLVLDRTQSKEVTDSNGNLVLDSNNKKQYVQQQWRWRYVDGDGSLDAVDSYIFKSKLERAGDCSKLDKPIDLDWEFAAMPSFDVRESLDIRGNLAYLCKCRHVPNSPITPQLVNARKFIEAAIAKAKSLNLQQRTEVMKLLMFSGDNDVFKVFSSQSEEEAQKLIDLVKSGKHKIQDAAGQSLLDKAQAQYKSTLLEVVSGWVAAARERGDTHFVSGAAGLGAFRGDPDVVAEVMAEAFAKHGGNMKFVFAKYPDHKPDAYLTMCSMREKFVEKFNALRGGPSAEALAPDRHAAIIDKFNTIRTELGANAGALQSYDATELGALGGFGNKDKGFPKVDNYVTPMLEALKAAKMPKRHLQDVRACFALAINLMSRTLDIFQENEDNSAEINAEKRKALKVKYLQALDNIQEAVLQDDKYGSTDAIAKAIAGQFDDIKDEELASRARLVLAAVMKYVKGDN